jgi:hypothetical protein
MTKIKNTIAYPLKPIPKRSDFFIGTDSENNGKTVSFGFEEVLNLLGNSGVKVREVYAGFLGTFVDQETFESSINSLLNSQDLVVEPNELVILAFDVLKTNPSSSNQNLVKYKYYFPLGQGTFIPLGDFVQYENLILTYEQPVEYNPDVIIDSPNVVVFPLGDIGSAEYLDFINQSETPFNLTDESKIYYFRFTKDDVDFLYLFDEENSVNGYGFYGAGFFQFSLSELVLFYDSDNNNEPVGQGVFVNNVIVSLSDGKTVGRYGDGETIPCQGLNLEQFANLIAQESIAPTVNLASPTTVQFNQTAIANVLNFSFTINTLGATVETVSLEFRRNNTGVWSVLTDDENLTTFTHNLTDTEFNTQVFNYRYVVTDSAGATNTALVNITPQAYVAPTITLSAGTLTRERGNIETDLTGTVTRNSSLVDISSYQVQVNIDGAGWNNVGSPQALTASGGAISFNHNDVLLVDSETIAYRVIVTDDFTTTTSVVRTVTLVYKNLLGYNSNAVLTISEILTLTDSELSNSKVRTVTGVTAGSGLFTYYAYNADAGDLTNIVLDGAAPVPGAFTQLTEVTGTNSFGATLTYKIYKSNATQAFDNNSLSFS